MRQKLRGSFTALFVITIIVGCHVPFKWSAWRYESDGLKSVPHWDLPLKNPGSSKFSVGDVYVHAHLKAHNETTQGGDSPYKLHVVCYAPKETVSTVVFHSVEVASELDSRTYPVTPIEVDRRGLKVKKLSFPYSEDFKAFYANASTASLVTDDTLALRPEENETVRIRILIEIISSQKNEKHWITYHFRPHLETGEIGYIGPGD